MGLYTISLWASLVGLVLLICWALVKVIVRREMDKSMKGQMGKMWELMGSKPLRLVVDIDKNGRTTIRDFKPIEKPDYFG